MIVFNRGIRDYPRYHLSFDTQREEVVLHYTDGAQSVDVYLDGDLVKAIADYAEDAGLGPIR